MNVELPLAPRSFEEKVPFGNYSGLVKDHDVGIWQKQVGRRRFQRKSWVFGGAFSSNGSLGFAIADVGYAAVAFCYYFDRHSEFPSFIEEEALLPLYFANDFKASFSESWHLKSGKREWNFENGKDTWNLKFQGERLQVSLTLQHKFPGISAIAPVEGRPFHYTYKLASIPAKVEVSIDDGVKHEWSGNYGAMDYSLGFPPRNVFWNWGSFAGTSEEGASIGINIAHPFNDGLENALWYNGQLIPLSTVNFVYKRPALENPWQIKSQDGLLNLEFYPEAEHSRKQNVVLLKSDFQHAVGHFSGTWKGVRISGSGVVEEHTAVW